MLRLVLTLFDQFGDGLFLLAFGLDALLPVALALVICLVHAVADHRGQFTQPLRCLAVADGCIGTR